MVHRSSHSDAYKCLQSNSAKWFKNTFPSVKKSPHAPLFLEKNVRVLAEFYVSIKNVKSISSFWWQKYFPKINVSYDLHTVSVRDYNIVLGCMWKCRICSNLN